MYRGRLFDQDMGPGFGYDAGRLPVEKLSLAKRISRPFLRCHWLGISLFQ